MARTPQLDRLGRALRRALLLDLRPDLRNLLAEGDDARLNQKVRPTSRRDFLKTVAVGAMAAPFIAEGISRRAWAAPDMPRFRGGNDPVVILGAGVSGLTAAYRLARAGVNCEVYEAQTRLGGRIYTKEHFNKEGMFCEIGGELIDSSHQDILTLAEELGLPVDDFRPYDLMVKKHQFYFNGQHYFDDDLSNACGPMAQRLLSDMAKVFSNPDDRTVTYQNHTPDAARFDQISLAEYLHSMTDVDKWVRDAVEMAYLTEFGLDSGEQSCINLMTMINPQRAKFGIYGDSDEAMRIHGGNSRLIEALDRKLNGHAKIERDHQLIRIAENGAKLELTFQRGSRTISVSAARAICTLPFTLLREVEGIQDLNLSPTKKRAIATLGYGTNMKHMVGFKDRRWREPQGTVPGSTGYTFTDLPSQTLWDTSRAQPGKSGIITTFLGGSAAMDPERGNLDSILSDMEAMCPGTSRLYDGNRLQVRWGKHPFAKGSYACPRPGQYTDIVGSAKEPELGGKLLFAGEHVSEKYQGYMNGAVQTGNEAAKTLLRQKHRERVLSF